MLAPLRCIMQICDYMRKQLPVVRHKEPLTIYNTASFLLNQMQFNLDQNMLEEGRFKPKLEALSLAKEVFEPILHLFEFELNAK